MAFFAKGSAFGELPEKNQERLLAITVSKEYKKGDVIFQEGEPGDGLFFVIHGAVKIVKLNEEGKEHIIHILGPGELFAEVLLFKKGVYPATAVSQQDSCVGKILNSDLEAELLQDNHLALAMIRALSNRLQVAQQKIRNLALADASEKVIQTLKQLSIEKGEPRAGEIAIFLPMNRQDLANLMGVSRETLARILAEWQDEGWLYWEGKNLVIRKKEFIDLLPPKGEE